MAELADKIAVLVPHAEGNPAAMIQVARMMRKDGQHEQALAQCRKALTLAPQDAELAAQVNRLLSEYVEAWHFVIVRDEQRNAAYDAALRRAIRPGLRVLEIGTGTSLLALMAARAGAAEVITCEMNPVIAEAAREIVARNGFADRVRVIAKHSDELDVEADLHGPVDILVSEIVSNNLLGQDVLAAHERAVRDLLKPGGRVIPARGAIRVALAEDLRDDSERLGVIDGFDLSSFNALMRPRQIRSDHERLKLRGEAADLFVFDFSVGQFYAPARACAACVATGGRVNGIAQWIALDMDGHTRYENRPAPDATFSCWAVMFRPLPHTIDTSPEQEIHVFGSHDRHQVSIWCDPTDDAIRRLPT
jgi:type II protein arginine methyltransferase